MKTPAQLFTRCGQALCGDGPKWKEQFGLLLKIKTDSIDGMSKGEKRIPPGAWYEIIRALRQRLVDLPTLEKLALAVSEVARLRPVLIDTAGTHIIRDGAKEVHRGALEQCYRWLDLEQERALLATMEREPGKS